ncbi:hypothetical protein N8J89_06225 [Crossiella sp. CA-258035]|uniref:hypothetical protein n=1 Tax=Crossiella sp. CA-258035 TaxID=2981138 RepID=UPI0024BCBD6C|nr:hypothetical protein [Crossiella sp. CA-258035]WHT20665.1 hypothetical protein N8J89_06225 [Crossiella sp. CA-258035]
MRPRSTCSPPCCAAHRPGGWCCELSAPARLVAQAVAVLGDHVDPELAAVAADLPPAQVQAAAAELFAIDLLRATEAGPRITFRHPLLRNAVYHSATPLWRAAAHGRVARLLARRGAPVSVCAPHIARSAAVGDSQAREVLREAAREVVPTAPATAASWLRAALELHPGTQDRDAVELRLELAQALVLTGRALEAREIATVLLGSLPAKTPELRLRATAPYAATSQLLLWPAGTREVLEAAGRQQPVHRRAAGGQRAHGGDPSRPDTASSVFPPAPHSPPVCSGDHAPPEDGRDDGSVRRGRARVPNTKAAAPIAVSEAGVVGPIGSGESDPNRRRHASS